MIHLKPLYFYITIKVSIVYILFAKEIIFTKDTDDDIYGIAAV